MPPALHDCVVAIGNFDGVHRGHQAVLERALELAERESRPAVVLTFEPHPRSFLQAGPACRSPDRCGGKGRNPAPHGL
ncbi:adenylyltransferase/cytidyltransferase family protein [Brucella abortus]|nr:adenylyltransferase/cytidyltransferase family protein [Brucella abortus]